MKRIFLIVLDSCGTGEMPDAAKFGDFGVNTLKSCSTSSKLHIPTMVHCGLGNIEGLSFLGTDPAQTGACARMAEASMGKDTTIGHWEIAGVGFPRIRCPPIPTASPRKCSSPSARRRAAAFWRTLPGPAPRSSQSTARSICARETSSFIRPQTPCSRSRRTRTSSLWSSCMNTAASPVRSSSESMASAASSPVRSSATRRTASPARPTATTFFARAARGDHA